MLLWLLACRPLLPDHCVITREADGDIAEWSVREMKGRRLVSSTLFTAQSERTASAETEHVYDGDLWTLGRLDSSLGDGEPTQEQRLSYDAEGRVTERLIVQMPENLLVSTFTYSWDGDRPVATTSDTPFTSWEEVWTWSGDTAVVEQTFFGGNQFTQIRSYAPSELSWPALDPDVDLPGLAFTSIGVDENGNGAIEDEERIRDQEVFDGVPSFSRLYDTSGGLISQTEWGDCPETP